MGEYGRVVQDDWAAARDEPRITISRSSPIPNAARGRVARAERTVTAVTVPTTPKPPSAGEDRCHCPAIHVGNDQGGVQLVVTMTTAATQIEW